MPDCSTGLHFILWSVRQEEFGHLFCYSTRLSARSLDAVNRRARFGPVFARKCLRQCEDSSATVKYRSKSVARHQRNCCKHESLRPGYKFALCSATADKRVGFLFPSTEHSRSRICCIWSNNLQSPLDTIRVNLFEQETAGLSGDVVSVCSKRRRHSVVSATPLNRLPIADLSHSALIQSASPESARHCSSPYSRRLHTFVLRQLLQHCRQALSSRTIHSSSRRHPHGKALCLSARFLQV